jgi:hypothetical protein
MRRTLISLCVVAGIELTSCASNRLPEMLSPDQKMTLHLSDVTAEVGPRVTMPQEALDRIVARIKEEIRTQAPNVLAGAGSGAPPPLAMKVVFTHYASGGVSTKTELRNVGLVQIEADVLFVDPQGKTVALSKVATHFGSGGDVGLSTNVLNVEFDFGNDVARLVR